MHLVAECIIDTVLLDDERVVLGLGVVLKVFRVVVELLNLLIEFRVAGLGLISRKFIKGLSTFMYYSRK